MPPIPFNVGQASGLEDLAGAPPLLLNCLTDATGTLKGRPGISAWSGFPATAPNASPVDAMIPFGSYLVYVTRDRKMFAIEPGAATFMELSTADPLTQLHGSLRPVMIALADKVVAVGGGAPQKWPGYGYSARLGGDPPNMVTIANLATRLVGNRNDPSGIFQWSWAGALGHEVWDPYNYQEAEARSDTLVAVASNTNELFAFGSQTLQVYSPDPTVGFAPGRAINVGLLSAYSLIAFDDLYGFVDREKRIVLTDGRGFGDENLISKQIQKSLRQLTASDAWGFRMQLDRWDAGVWMFPTSGKGFMWNKETNHWSEWRAFGASGFQAPKITSAVSWPERDVHLVGLDDGRIAKLDVNAYTDLGDTIPIALESGAVSHGTDALKHCRMARFVFKRGETAQTGTAPRVDISWRDDRGNYCQPIRRDLGLAGDYNPVVELYSLGSPYRRRWWKVEFSAAADFTFVGAEEAIEVLSN